MNGSWMDDGQSFSSYYFIKYFMFLGGVMEYIKKAAKTAESDTEKIRSIVQGILSDIEKNGEDAVIKLAKKFDNWDADFILSEEKKQRLIAAVPENIKQDIRFAHEQVHGFAKLQRDSIKEFETETLPGVRLGPRIIPMAVSYTHLTLPTITE